MHTFFGLQIRNMVCISFEWAMESTAMGLLVEIEWVQEKAEININRLYYYLVADWLSVTQVDCCAYNTHQLQAHSLEIVHQMTHGKRLAKTK